MPRHNTGLIALLALCLVCVAIVRVLPRRLEGVAPAAEQQARDEVARRLGAKPGNSVADAKVDAWIAAHGEEHTRRIAELEESFKDEHRFRGEDGRDHAYLADLDSYFWLRLARNYLRHGSVCDRVLDGVCRDDMAPAPVGREQIYARSLHTGAIVGLHRLITAFAPGFPLSSTSYYVPVLIGMLGVIPAFLLGWRFGGDVGAVVAAVACGANPAFLTRSIGSDNDVWNVVLPLCALWACVGSLAAKDLRARLAYALAAGVFVGLHAAVWSGWLFTHAIALAGFVASLLYTGLRAALRQRDARLWRDAALRAVAASAVAYIGVAGVAVSLADPKVGFAASHLEILKRVPWLGTSGAPPPLDLDRIVWPSHFSSVAELRKMHDMNPAKFDANIPSMILGFAGAALLVLPRRRWQRWHLAVFATGAAVLAYLYNAPEATRAPLTHLLLPAALALAAVATSDRSEDESERGALFLLAWLGSAYTLSSESNRFVMFLAPPVAIGLAVCADRTRQLIVAYLGERLGARGIVAASVIVVTAGLAYPLQRGWVIARDQLPQMTDAWWDTLTGLHSTAAADAIINAWWHDGHWITYGAERRVSADGASLRTHVPYWFTHALLTGDERHSAGLLRMLACGSDALPYPEGALGAYGKLRASGLGVFEAQGLVDKLAAVDHETAVAELARRGLSPEAAAGVLQATHCQPPANYLVLSDRLTASAGWAVGQWDFRRAFAARWAASLPRDEALQALQREAGYSESEAREVYREAPRGDAGRVLEAFISPELGYLTKEWLPCVPDDTGASRACFLAAKVSNAPQVLEAFEYNASSPASGRLRILHQGGRTRYTYRTPGTIIVAGPSRSDETHPPGATDPGIAVLIDTVGHRLLLAEAELLNSTFTKLMFLDGRYLKRFEKVQEHSAYTGERVVTYRVRYD